ncbi:ATP-binding protein [Gemmatimonas sp.]|uniref:GAF domain-containing sensor histidine kinase n=1 Tax=Gemmatimonas sp. TaxID=1962908 RepID=UPI00286BE974|nr:ATP-binding protein [Gemmatimonas sp.]
MTSNAFHALEPTSSLRSRTEALAATELMDAPTSVVLDRLTRAASRLLGVPVSLVSLVDDYRQLFAGVTDRDNVLQGARETRLRDSICRHVVESSAPLIIPDTRCSDIARAINTDPGWWVKSYVGVPLATADGITLGALCAIDTVPRIWSEAEIESLGDLAFAAAAELDLRISLHQRRLSETRFQAFMDHSPVVAVLLDRDGILEYANAMFGIHFEVPVQQAVGRSISTMSDPLAQAIAAQCALVLRSGQCAECTETLTTPDGDERQWLLYTFPVNTNTGQGAVGTVALDLTQRRMLERQLQQSQKLEAIGQLASGIAHEINTPSQYVSDNVQFLQQVFNEIRWVLDDARDGLDRSTLERSGAGERRNEMTPETAAYLADEVPRAFEQTIEGMQRIAGIVHSIKAFSHPGGADAEDADINAALANTLVVARNEWKFVAVLETNYDPTLPPVRCFPGELNQVFLNIIVNAAQAMAASLRQGTLRVTTRADGEQVHIIISDTGTGIPERIRDKIFNPFFTTKPVGTGTGQGLAISHTVVVEKHGGQLTCDSVEGVGTAFTITLPIKGCFDVARQDVRRLSEEAA